MKILIIFTGGTIGSQVGEEYISLNSATQYLLIKKYSDFCENNKIEFPEFDTAIPYSILSENLNGDNLRALGECIENNLSCEKEYEGIIVTHGTDTLQYSAAMMDIYFKNISIPVVFVSSNYPLDDIRANGFANFCAAVDFIKAKKETGVFISYRNSDHSQNIFHGALALPHIPYSDDVFSLDPPSEYFKANDSALGESYSLPVKSSSPVLRIFPYPGMTYPKLKEDNLPLAILFDTYHSGTLCSDNSDFIAFVSDANRFNIPLFVTGAYDGPDYSSTSIWKELQINVLPKASPIAIYMKLWLLLSVNPLPDNDKLIQILMR